MHRDLGGIAKTGHLLQRQLRFGRQAGQLRNQEVHYIFGVALGMDAIEIPRPACRIMIESEYSFVDHRRNELNGKEWIATRLLMYQLRKRCTAFRLAAKGFRNQLREMLSSKRLKRNLIYFSASSPNRFQLAHERMR